MKCKKCKKGDMHFVSMVVVSNLGYNEYRFMCDNCGDTREFKK